MQIRTVILFVVLISIIHLSAPYITGCSENEKRIGLEQNLLYYEDHEAITFTISGNAKCSQCDDDDLPIDALEIEVYPKGSMLERLGLKVTEGPGNFSIPGITAEKGSIVELHATLLREGTEGLVTAYNGYAEVTVPDNDGDTVATIINFPSSEEDEE